MTFTFNPSEPRYCNRALNCDVKIILAILAPTPPGAKERWAAFEATDREPFSEAAAGARVIVSGRQAWRPIDLIEDYRVRHGLTETAARELVTGFPWHRPHHHDTEQENHPS